uniref:RRM domain-containing protein n=1 Tax=Setaria digitata TaxID=48799 RepID=A0A915Q480_9BILA
MWEKFVKGYFMAGKIRDVPCMKIPKVSPVDESYNVVGKRTVEIKESFQVPSDPGLKMQPRLKSKAPQVVLSLRLKEFDLKCVPIKWDRMDVKTYEKQLQLGEAVFEALVQWHAIAGGKTDVTVSKLVQDVRNQIVKHTNWIINFIGACGDKKKNEANSKLVWDGVQILLRHFRGMDKNLDCTLWLELRDIIYLLDMNYQADKDHNEKMKIMEAKQERLLHVMLRPRHFSRYFADRPSDRDFSKALVMLLLVSTMENGNRSESIDESVNESELERRFIDGKWFCEDGNGGFLVFEEDKWVIACGDDLGTKWNTAGTVDGISGNPYRCIVDGITMEWNQISQQWLPVVEITEDFLAQYHSSYGVKYDFAEKEGPSLERKKGKSEDHKSELMSKCGVIQRDARTNKLKIKLYRNDDGTFKGDGRCCYIKKESVIMALDILDGWNLDGKIISVEKAKFQMKGEFDPSKKKKKLTAAQKKRFIESQERIFEWKPEKPRNYRPVSDCTIVMKNMFTLEQMMKNAALLLDLEEETRKVCERFGVVKKVIVHDNNPEGVICVTFQNVECSDAAVRSLNSRIVDGRQISVALWDGKTRYKV